ncbi:hypothetical protein TNCV_1390421 [Trichonephila clavipes]|nr:hypothetical protein TNCV_1390421 [Trichonephila clavipes]
MRDSIITSHDPTREHPLSSKLKLDGRGRRRDSAFTQKDGRNRKNHERKRNKSRNIPRQNGEGGRTPKLETLYRSRAAAGGGEERRKAVGTAESSKSKQ